MVLIAYTTAPDDTPDWVVRAARHMPFFPAGGTVVTSPSLGQNMYTPTDIALPNPPMTERPYAGFLYLGLGFATDNTKEQQQLQLQLGVVGPASLADQTQTWFHRLIGVCQSQGLAHPAQERTRPCPDIRTQLARLCLGQAAGSAFDLSPHLGGAIGNVYDYANAGAMVRFGFELPNDFGPMRIDPALPGANFYEPKDDGFSWYLFAGVDGRAIARNLFLDGNSFVNSRSVDKLPFVGDMQFGAAISIGGSGSPSPMCSAPRNTARSPASTSSARSAFRFEF